MTSIYSGLNYTTQEINLDFRIKVYGYDEEGNKINKLVGVSGLINLIGIELTNKFFGRAYRDLDDKLICKLRRGLKITFYAR